MNAAPIRTPTPPMTRPTRRAMDGEGEAVGRYELDGDCRKRASDSGDRRADAECRRLVESDVAGFDDLRVAPMLSANAAAFCSTTMIAVPDPRRTSTRASNICRVIIGARPKDGSSSSIIARVIASICYCPPPERVPACWWRQSFRRGKSTSHISMSCWMLHRSRRGMAPKLRFSSVVSVPKVPRTSDT